MRRNGQLLALPRSKKTRALLGYLVASDEVHSRQTLCDLLYEGRADPRAALRWSLSKLRPLVDYGDATRLVSDRDQVRFEAHQATVDLTLVRMAAAPDPETVATDLLQKAASRFRGEFLQGLDLSSCYRFDTWCTTEREAVHVLRDKILRVLIDRFPDQPEAALPYARDRLLMDPLSEEAHIGFMRLLGAMGRTDEALQQYDRCRRMLDLEFDARPSRELEDVRRSLSRTSVTSVAPPAIGAAIPSSLPPIVGRREERDLLRCFLQHEAAPGEVLLLEGVPGIGKTRLLEELGTLVTDAGGTVLPGRAFDVERVRPYTAWIDVLRAVNRDRIPQALRAELAPLLPELGPASEDVTDRNRLFDAVVGLLGYLDHDERPLCLLLDDVHWFDEASIALLHYVARATVGRNLFLACAARTAELQDNTAARRLVHTLRRDGRLRRIDLSPLDETDTVRLVQQVSPDLDGELVFAESEGNPLFTLEVARALRQGKGVHSDTLDGLITERITELDAQAQKVVYWSAALGRSFSLELLSRLAGTSTIELVDAVEELTRHGLLQATNAGRYDFSHDLVRRAAYQSMSVPRCRLIHHQIAHKLAGADDLDEAMSGEVAHHAVLGGDFELAARASAAAGRHSLRVFACEEAAALAQQGLDHLVELPQETRLALHFELLALYVHPNMKAFRPVDLVKRLRQLTKAAQVAGRCTLVYRGFDLIAWHYYHRGDFGGTLKALFERKDAVAEADPVTVVKAFADASHCLCLLEREMERAEDLAREAQALFDEFDLNVEPFELCMALGMLRRHAGALEEAHAHVARALECSQNDPLPWAQYHCLSHLVMIEIESERPEMALASCRLIPSMAKREDESSEVAFMAALESLARLSVGETEAWMNLNEAVERLRLIDSKWMLAYVQNIAAVRAIEHGHPESALERAHEAFAAAEAVHRPSEVALAKAVLARLALYENEPDEVNRHLDMVRPWMKEPRKISARARKAVEEVIGQSRSVRYANIIN